jgi:hypothetical protein
LTATLSTFGALAAIDGTVSASSLVEVVGALCHHIAVWFALF